MTLPPSAAQEIPGPAHLGPVAAAAALLEFVKDWRGYFWKARAEHQSNVFHIYLAGSGVALTDRESIWSAWQSPSVMNPYGFGPRYPWPSAIDDTVPIVFSNDEAHVRRKGYLRALIRRGAGRLESTFDAVFDRYAARWALSSFFDWSAELERFVAELVFTWLLGAGPAPDLVRNFEANAVPIRVVKLPLPGDLTVHKQFGEIVAIIRAAPYFREALPDLGGLSEEEAARELAFTLIFNGYGALSGAVISTLGELSVHPDVEDGVRDELRAAWGGGAGGPPPLATLMSLQRTRHVVREAQRLHPPAPVIFRQAKEDFTVVSRTGSYAVKQGEILWGVLEIAQRDPATFAEPDRFEPDRFSDPAAGAALSWADGPPAPGPTAENRVCGARDEGQLIVQLLLSRLMPRYRWALTDNPVWGAALVARNLPSASMHVASFFPEERAATWTAPEHPAGFGAELRARVISGFRALHEASVEHWSRVTFRPEDHAASEPPPEIVTAAAFYGQTDLPSYLRVAKPLPESGRLGVGYVVPYYYTAGLMLDAYALSPIPSDVAWTPGDPSNALYPENPEHWGNLQNDDTFTELRLSGPNPFLLARRPEAEEWVADYGPFFEGIAPRVACAFRRGGDGLVPVSIQVDDATHRPGDPGWPRARRLANALDARLAVFGQHLGVLHLILAQAYALSRFVFAPAHPLRAFFELHGYGTLEVNHYAYLLLVSPSSYFLMSSFITREQALRIFDGAWRTASVEQLIPPRDLARRGIAGLPGHAYAEDAPEAWAVFHAYARGFVGRVYADDAAVANDPEAQAWHAQMVSLLPNTPADMTGLRTRADLSLWLAACVYANVAHKIAGDFSQYTDGTDAEQMSLLNLTRVLEGEEGGPIALNDVALMKQGGYASRFSPGGNLFFQVPPEARTPNQALVEEGLLLQAALVDLDTRLAARNQARRIPFLRMMPRIWEISVGF